MKSRSLLFTFFYSWLPAIACMAFIFYLSSRQSLKVADEYVLNFLFFKSLHLIEYAVLYLLVFRAVYTINGLELKSKFYISIAVAIMYALSDELHQTFVPTREGTIRDVFIDTVGILLAFTYTKYNLPFLKKFL